MSAAPDSMLRVGEGPVESYSRTKQKIRCENLNLVLIHRFENENTQLAAALGTTAAYVSALRHGRKSVGDDVVARIEAAAGLPPGWMDEDREEFRERAVTALDDLVFIPLFDLRVNPDNGESELEERVIKMRAFERTWIRLELGVRPKDLGLAEMKGHSMREKLFDGDLVMFNRREREPDDDIFVFRLGKELMIKTLQRRPSNKLLVISANPEWQPFEIELDKAPDFEILGRYAWHAHTNRRRSRTNNTT